MLLSAVCVVCSSKSPNIVAFMTVSSKQHALKDCLLQFVVETRPTGAERELTEGRTQEYLSTEEKIVEVTKPNPCGGVPTS